MIHVTEFDSGVEPVDPDFAPCFEAEEVRASVENGAESNYKMRSCRYLDSFARDVGQQLARSWDEQIRLLRMSHQGRQLGTDQHLPEDHELENRLHETGFYEARDNWQDWIDLARRAPE